MNNLDLNFVVLTKIMLLFWIIIEVAYMFLSILYRDTEKIRLKNTGTTKYLAALVIISYVLSGLTLLNYLTLPFYDIKLSNYLSGWDTIILVITSIFRTATLFFMMGVKFGMNINEKIDKL